jgi:3-hydroxymyristoyl/3-hydroxydecanoyl-(acyl carrier protein) dehydratase
MTGVSLQDHVAAALLSPVRELEPGHLTGLFRFPGSSGVFSGHFPGKPILPGIAQILAALLVAGKGTAPPLRQIKRCKFTRAVLPNEDVSVNVRLSGGEKDQAPATAELYVGEEKCASMSLLVGSVEANRAAP